MGKRYEEYKEAVAMNNAAKADVHVAYGGSTAARMEHALKSADIAQGAEERAWARVEEDPEE